MRLGINPSKTLGLFNFIEWLLLYLSSSSSLKGKYKNSIWRAFSSGYLSYLENDTVTPVVYFGTSISLLTTSLVLFLDKYFDIYDFLLAPQFSVDGHSHPLC